MTYYGDNFTLFYVDYAYTSQETHLRTSTVCYILFVDDVRTTRETHL
jgi:hypothetical protein